MTGNFLLARTEADLPLLSGVAGQLAQLFGVRCEVAVADASLPERSIILERRGTTQRTLRAGGVLQARVLVEGPLATRSFKFKLTIDSTFGGVPTDDDLLTSLAGQLLPFFQGGQPPLPLALVVCSSGCGLPFAEELAEALSYERFDCEVRPERGDAANWISPGIVKGPQLRSASLAFGAHSEEWGPVKVESEALATKVAARFRTWVSSLR